MNSVMVILCVGSVFSNVLISCLAKNRKTESLKSIIILRNVQNTLLEDNSILRTVSQVAFTKQELDSYLPLRHPTTQDLETRTVPYEFVSSYQGI